MNHLFQNQLAATPQQRVYADSGVSSFGPNRHKVKPGGLHAKRLPRKQSNIRQIETARSHFERIENYAVLDPDLSGPTPSAS